MASDREKLYRVVRELRRWVEWQDAGDGVGVIPASDERREQFRERLAELQRAKVERMKESLRDEGKAEGEADERAPDTEPSAQRAEEEGESKQLWKEMGSRRSTAAEASGGDEEAGGESPRSGGGGGEPQTNEEKLEWLREYLGDCRRCPLWKNRQNLVFGEGDAEADLVFVGEAPGAREDRTGRPFVGRAGQLLNDMIEAMGLQRGDVYICNVLKSRPPDNRDPSPEEVQSCFPFLQKQLEIIEPEVIVTLGRPATQNLLRKDELLGAMRGKWHEWEGIEVMPTYHPAYLLRNPDMKRKTWNDLQHVIDRLDLSGPGA